MGAPHVGGVRHHRDVEPFERAELDEPAVAVFARTNLLETVPGKAYQDLPTWFKTWESSELIAWVDKNGDGKVQYDGSGAAFAGKPAIPPPADAVSSSDVKPPARAKDSPRRGRT